MKPNEIQTSDHHPKVSIGLPVYNGEKFIRKKLESLLMQTFKDFEIIISDNASTDSTSKICEEFVAKDNRIKYFRQEKTIEPILNYYYVLKKANCKYFVWTSVDDILYPEFLEKNLQILEKNEHFVCSISKIKLYGPMTEYIKSESSEKSFFSKIHKKIYQKIGYQSTFRISGNYMERIKQYIKNIRHNQVLYGLYRTEQIKKSFVKESFIGNDAAITFNLLKYGEIFVIDEILMEVYDEGMSRSGMIQVLKKMHHKNLGLIFPFLPFTLWCKKNLDKSICMRNLPFFLKINCEGVFSLCFDILRKLRLKI